MDLLDFEPGGPGTQYFDEPLDVRAATLIEQAAQAYGSPEAEAKLRQAEAIAPEHLGVLVALYRHYFYRHQHSAALAIAAQAMNVVARRLNFANVWAAVGAEDIARAVIGQAELTRFYLHALKGAGYLHLRLGAVDEGLKRLDHVAALDPKDRIGAKALADVVRQALQTDAA
jgi:tetratricopeptide (TPR) repeat protein